MSTHLTKCFESMNLCNAPHPFHYTPLSLYPIHAKLIVFNETIEWHRKNIEKGKPISINMLFLISLIEPIHKLYKIDNNSIINWCFRDIYLAIFGTQTPPLSETETNMNNMYKNFYYSAMHY